MLELICAGSLALSIGICQNPETIDFGRINLVSTTSISQQNELPQTEYLAKGKPHESKYRREADRELDELRGDRDRYDRNSDRYRSRDDYNRDRYNRDRIYREPHRRGREVEYDDDRDRYYIPRNWRDYLRRRSR
ncbi:MAG: hypothetical protein AAF298_18105 [Cyanobacteria bacterium P01_A01_bin.40]